jgi:anti-sigma B factor antagonist
MAAAHFATTVLGDRVVVSVVGEFDLSVRAEGTQVLTAAVDAAKGGQVIVDLSQVGFLDSSGIAALLAGMHAARRAGASYRLSGVGGLVQRVLAVTGLLGQLTDEVDSTAA